MNTDSITRTLVSRLRALEYLASVETSRGVEVVAVRHPRTRVHGEPWLVALISTADWSVDYAVPVYRSAIEGAVAGVLDGGRR
ncbi:MAG: hypothetical protein VYE22_09830 [Myxococcota bacterium]|nr:hypothetical protein [Myxococcota bacterium]